MNKYEHSEEVLENGLKIVHLPVADSPAVYLSITGKVGRRAELDAEVGSAHFLEHLFFDGTVKRPKSLILNEFIESYGGLHNGSTGSETVDYWCKILSEHAEIGFDYLSDILLNSLLNEIEKERKVIAQEAAMNRDNPSKRLTRAVKGTLYPNQSVGRTIFDEEKNLPKMNRDMLLEYRDRTYTANNFILAIAGNIEKEQAFSLAGKYFGSFKSGNEIIFEPAKIEGNERVDIINGDFKQSKLAISFKGYPTNTKEEKIVSLLNSLFGQGLSSRLLHRIRNELNLAYSIGIGAGSFSDTGFVSIETAVDESNLQRTTREIFKEIDKLLKFGIRDDELDKAKNRVLSRILFSLEGLGFYSGGFVNRLLWNKDIKEVQEELDELRNITKDEVMAVAHQVFSDNPKINVLTKSFKSLEL
jgi:predicted Zn-dependent peptidase